MNVKLTPEKLTAFCAALAETANVTRACEAVDISRYTAYVWRKNDPDFAARWDEAMKAALLGLEDEAHRRAFDGVDEPVYYQGQACGTVRKYSDTLAIFLLKAHAPEKYRERSSMELTGKDGGPIEITEAERAAKVAALVAKAQQRQAQDAADLV